MGDSNSSTSATRVIAALAVISLLAVSGIPVAALTLANASKASGTAAAQQPSTTLLATPAGLQSRGGAPATIASESVSGIGASLLSPVTTLSRGSAGASVWPLESSQKTGFNPDAVGGGGGGGTETPVYSFLSNSNASELDEAEGSTVGGDGSLYVVGTTVAYKLMDQTDSLDITVVGGFLAKFNSEGAPAWIDRWANVGTGRLSVATAGAYVYVAGSAYVACTSPCDPTYQSQYQVSVLAQFTTSGAFNWARTWSQPFPPDVSPLSYTTYSDAAFGVAASPNTGMVYVIDNSAALTTNLTPLGGEGNATFTFTQPFLLTYNANGGPPKVQAFPNCRTEGTAVCNLTALNSIAVRYNSAAGQDQVYVGGEEGLTTGADTEAMTAIVGMYQGGSLAWVNAFDFKDIADTIPDSGPVSEVTTLTVAQDGTIYVGGSVYGTYGSPYGVLLSLLVDTFFLVLGAVCGASVLCAAVVGAYNAYQIVFELNNIPKATVDTLGLKTAAAGFVGYLMGVFTDGQQISQDQTLNPYPFVAKLDSSGNLIWTDILGYDQREPGSMIALAPLPTGAGGPDEGLYAAANFGVRGGIAPGMTNGTAIFSIGPTGTVLSQAAVGPIGLSYSDFIAGLNATADGNLEIAGSASGIPPLFEVTGIQPYQDPIGSSNVKSEGPHPLSVYAGTPLVFGSYMYLASTPPRPPVLTPVNSAIVLSDPPAKTVSFNNAPRSGSPGIYWAIVGPPNLEVTFSVEPSTAIASIYLTAPSGSGTTGGPLTLLSVFPGAGLDVSVPTFSQLYPSSGYQFPTWTSTGLVTINKGNPCCGVDATVYGGGSVTANFATYFQVRLTPTSSEAAIPSGGNGVSVSSEVQVSQTLQFSAPDSGLVGLTASGPSDLNFQIAFTCQSSSYCSYEPPGQTPTCIIGWGLPYTCTVPMKVTVPSSTPPGTYAVTVTGTSDMGTAPISVATYTITILPPLVVTVTPASPSIDLGQSITLTANPSGGSGMHFSYQWYSNAACTTSISGATSASYKSSPAATTTFCVKITDSASSPSSGTATDVVKVNPALTAGPITSSASTISSGQSVTLTANPAGGTGKYSYVWYSGGSATCSSDRVVSGQTGATYSPSPTSSTYYCYRVSDSAFIPSTATSATYEVVVGSSGALSISPSSGQDGTVVSLSGSGYAPSTAYDFCYSATDSACSSYAFTSTATGTIPSGTTFAAYGSPGTYYVTTEHGGVLIGSATFALADPSTLSVSPTSGPDGTVVTLSGSDYAPSTSYDYCYSASDSVCYSYTFTSTAGGTIPVGTTFTTSGAAGTYYVTTEYAGVLLASATFTVAIASGLPSTVSGISGVTTVCYYDGYYYVFGSGGPEGGPAYVTSSDGGNTWSSATQIFSAGGGNYPFTVSCDGSGGVYFASGYSGSYSESSYWQYAYGTMSSGSISFSSFVAEECEHEGEWCLPQSIYGYSSNDVVVAVSSNSGGFCGTDENSCFVEVWQCTTSCATGEVQVIGGEDFLIGSNWNHMYASNSYSCEPTSSYQNSCSIFGLGSTSRYVVVATANSTDFDSGNVVSIETINGGSTFTVVNSGFDGGNAGFLFLGQCQAVSTTVYCAGSVLSSYENPGATLYNVYLLSYTDGASSWNTYEACTNCGADDTGVALVTNSTTAMLVFGDGTTDSQVDWVYTSLSSISFSSVSPLATGESTPLSQFYWKGTSGTVNGQGGAVWVADNGDRFGLGRHLHRHPTGDPYDLAY